MGLRCGGQKIPSRGCCSYFVSPSGEEPEGMKAAEGRGSCWEGGSVERKGEEAVWGAGSGEVRGSVFWRRW